MPFPPVPKEVSNINYFNKDDTSVLLRSIVNDISSIYLYLQRLRDQSFDEISTVLASSPTIVGDSLSVTNTSTISLSINLGVLSADLEDLSITTLKVGNNQITYPKLQQVSASRLLGNPSGAGANVSEISLGSDHTFSGTTLTLSTNGVTYSKLQQESSVSLLGNPTGALANVSEITLAADLAFSGTTLRVGAYTGDIVKSAGSLATTISNSAVTYAKIQNVAANRLLGREASGTGVVEELSLGVGLSLTSTTLNTTIQLSRVSSQFDKTTDVTLADITGLTATLVSTGIYYFKAILFISASAVGGSKYSIAGTATATTIHYEITLLDDTSNVYTITDQKSALGSSSGQAGTTAGYCIIEGVINVANTGTLTVQFAQNVSNLTSSVLVDSFFRVERIS